MKKPSFMRMIVAICLSILFLSMIYIRIDDVDCHISEMEVFLHSKLVERYNAEQSDLTIKSENQNDYIIATYSLDVEEGTVIGAFVFSKHREKYLKLIQYGSSNESVNIQKVQLDKNDLLVCISSNTLNNIQIEINGNEYDTLNQKSLSVFNYYCNDSLISDVQVIVRIFDDEGMLIKSYFA